MADGELVTIATFRTLGEAHVAKGALESEGIDCELADENTAVNYPLAIGVRLQVLAEDEVQARQILVDVEPETDEGTSQDQKVCPKCGSPRIDFVKIVLSEDPSHWQCKECGARWVVEPDEPL